MAHTIQLTAEQFAAVTAHAEREGADDYTDRADDVATGQQTADWAWPLIGADEAYINAIGTEAIVRECGLEDDAWEEISDVWCAGFARGYRAAHAAAVAAHPTIVVETRVTGHRPTEYGVRNGVDYDAELWVTDAGVRHAWQGALTYAPDPGRAGELAPYGGAIDHWMSAELVRALRTPWVAAHQRLVDAIVQSLGDGPGVETITVVL